MSKEFKTPDPGEGIHEVEIVELHVSEGDRVQEGDTILAVESDKATVDVPASFTGTIESIEVAQGDVVEVGEVLFTYEEGDGDGESRTDGDEGRGDDEDDEDEDQDEGEDRDEDDDEEERTTAKRKSDRAGRGKSSGKRKDKEKDKAKEAKPRKRGKGGKSREEPDHDERSRAADVEASPATRRLARELSIDLTDVPGSGPGGRVLGRDVRTAVRRRDGAERQPAPTLPDPGRWGEVTREPLRGIRRATARRMAESWSQIPHVTHTHIADVTDLEAFRREHAGDLDAKLTLTVLAVKALTAALRRFPRFNAALDPRSDEIVYRHYCHIGVAVATEAGLLVPVLRDADRKTLRELAAELETLSGRARERRLEADDMKGASMSVTNVGGVGGDHFTPIINHPEAAILGIAAMREVPALVRREGADPRLEGRLHLPLILAFDHRLNDGMDAAEFVNAIAGALSEPESLLLAI